MKPFNLEEAKAGKPIVCRDGTPAKFIAHVPEATTFGGVIFLSGTRVYQVGTNGTTGYHDPDHAKDLFMAPETRTVKFQIVASKSGKEIRATSFTHEVNDEWIILARNVEVTFTEGEGL